MNRRHWSGPVAGTLLFLFAICAVAAAVVYGASLLRPKTTLEIFAQGIEEEPRNPKSYESYGYMLLVGNQPAQAEQQFRVELSLDPRSKSGRYLLGIALARRSRYADARAEWEAALPGASPELARKIKSCLRALGKLQSK